MTVGQTFQCFSLSLTLPPPCRHLFAHSGSTTSIQPPSLATTSLKPMVTTVWFPSCLWLTWPTSSSHTHQVADFNFFGLLHVPVMHAPFCTVQTCHQRKRRVKHAVCVLCENQTFLVTTFKWESWEFWHLQMFKSYPLWSHPCCTDAPTEQCESKVQLERSLTFHSLTLPMCSRSHCKAVMWYYLGYCEMYWGCKHISVITANL